MASQLLQDFLAAPSLAGAEQLFTANPALAASIVAVVPASLYAAKLAADFLRTGKVDWQSTRHGGELVAEVLKQQGVKHVFTLVGGHISPILVSCEEKGIKVVDTRHEVTAVFAADAVARLTGVPGVAAVTAGPGLTNTVTAVKNAQMAESPLLLIGGAAATMLKGRGALQDIDQMVLFKPICKYVATINHIKDIPNVLRTALREAQSGVPGPVFVEFPIDTLYPVKYVAEGYGMQIDGGGDKGKGKSKGLMARVVDWYLRHHVARLYGDAFGPHHDFSPLPFEFPRHTAAQLGAAVALVKGAKRPVMLMGSQSTLPPTTPEALVKAVEALGVPTYLGGMSRGLLGRDSPIHCRQKRRDALREADVIILAGSVCDFRLDYGRLFNRRAKVIACNRSREHLTKNTDMFWKAHVCIQGDVGCFLTALADGVRGYQYPAEWLAGLKAGDVAKESANRKKAAEPVNMHMNPLQLLHDFEELIDENTLLVADGGDFVGSAAYIVRPRGPLRWLDPGAFGTLGVGGGFALGAKLARPDMDVWIIYGDGSLGYSVAETDTFARHNLGVISLVGNDACWTQIAREQVPMFNSAVACDLEFTNYHVVAEGYGGKGYLLDDIKKSKEVLKKALEESRKTKKPQLINALIGKTNFRDGSLSV